MTFSRKARDNPWQPDVVLSFPENRAQAAALAAALGAESAEAEIHAFPDGESLVRIPRWADCQDKRVALYRSLDRPNAKIVELMLATSVLAGAREIMLIAPYLSYMRQDKAFHDGEAVSQMAIGKLLATHFHRFVTVDPHLHRQPSLDPVFQGRPSLCLTAAEPIAAYIRHTLPPDTVILGPDEESTVMTGKIAVNAGRAWSVARKIRHGDRDVEIALPESRSFRDRTVVIVDDVISSGRTVAVLAARLHAAGAARVVACATHALHDAEAARAMAEAGIDFVASSDTVTHDTNRFSVLETIAWSLKDPHDD